MKTGWKKLPFEEVIADVSGGNVKTPQGEFLSEGRFAIVDQGKELISGHANEEKRLCRVDLPVIIFGDHTRCFKYVDFPFCMGADGVKVLRPKIEAEVKYLYYYLRHLHITDGGYSRHFKYLKQCEVVLPPLDEQRKIVEILDRAEALQAKRRTALAQLDELIQSIYIDIFGDAVSNPKGWKRYPLKDCINHIQIGPFGSLLHKEDYVFGGIPLINPMHIEDGNIVPDLNQSVTVQKHAELQLYQFQQGDVIMGRRGEMGRCAIVRPEHNGMLCGTGSLFIRPDESKATATYLQATLSSTTMRKHLEGLSLGATLPNLNRGIVGELAISLPPLVLQFKFATRITAVEKLKAAHKASLAELYELFLSLQYRALRGEL
ncbi:MAG: restriction endonuclease subunit S [Methanosarcina barkeri]|nr:restriction endonuclease subunit S [Methanosarcina sp. ERenArc_MAG2]